MKIDRGWRIKHGRPEKVYEPGETPSRYGVARQLENGTYEFISEYGNWRTDYAFTWRSPPDHYLVTRGKISPKGAFIVNFNKPSAPQPLKGFHR